MMVLLAVSYSLYSSATLLSRQISLHIIVLSSVWLLSNTLIRRSNQNSNNSSWNNLTVLIYSFWDNSPDVILTNNPYVLTSRAIFFRSLESIRMLQENTQLKFIEWHNSNKNKSISFSEKESIIRDNVICFSLHISNSWVEKTENAL